MNTGGDIHLYWIPLGAGGRVVRWNGRIYEAIAARSAHRPRRDLYHAALTVRLDDVTTSIEMGPVWNVPDADRGVVGTGPVGSPVLGRVRMFRYEIRCWPGGRIPDLDYAVDSSQVSANRARATRVLALTREVPLATWGRDEQRAGEMWNSNSMVSWLLARSGHDLARVQPPVRGRAPGWDAGLVVAARGSPTRPPGVDSPAGQAPEPSSRDGACIRGRGGKTDLTGNA